MEEVPPTPATSTPRSAGPPIGGDWLFLIMVIATLLVIVVVGERWICAAGGWAMPLAIAGTTLAVVLRRRWPWRAWVAGFGLSLAGAVVIASVLTITRPARVFREVFEQEVPADVTLLRARQTLVLRDPAAMVVFDADAATINRLLDTGGFERDTAGEEQIGGDASNAAFQLLASGTSFMDDVDPSAGMQIWRRKEGSRWRYVIYEADRGRAYAFWLAH